MQYVVNDVNKRSQVFMPLLDDVGGHWLFIADLHEHQYMVYDSLTITTTTHRQLLLHSAVSPYSTCRINCDVHHLSKHTVMYCGLQIAKDNLSFSFHTH